MFAPAPLILTLHLDDHSAAHFTALRQTHFPSAINYLPAHVTLFHSLPSSDLPGLQADVQACCQSATAIRVNVTGLRFLGRGVAYKLESATLSALRRRLEERWNPLLQPQDRQPFHPHITVQNKVQPDEAKILHRALTAEFQPREIEGTGVDFWYYRGGPWEHAAFVPFY